MSQPEIKSLCRELVAAAELRLSAAERWASAVESCVRHVDGDREFVRDARRCVAQCAHFLDQLRANAAIATEEVLKDQFEQWHSQNWED